MDDSVRQLKTRINGKASPACQRLKRTELLSAPHGSCSPLFTKRGTISVEAVRKLALRWINCSSKEIPLRERALTAPRTSGAPKLRAKSDVYHDRRSIKRRQSAATETGSCAATLAGATSRCSRSNVGSCCRQRQAESPAELSAMLSRRGGGVLSEATATVHTRVGVSWPSPHL